MIQVDRNDTVSVEPDTAQPPEAGVATGFCAGTSGVTPDGHGGPQCLGRTESEEMILDVAVIDELRRLDPDGSAGLIPRLAELFMARTEETLKAPYWSSDASDVVAIGRTAHALKSSAGAMGAKRLAALCGSLEKRIREGQAVDVRWYFAEIRSAYVEAREALKRTLSGVLA